MKKASFVFLTAFSVWAHAQPAPQSMVEAFMQRMDLNKDGSVDRIEYLTPYEQQFKRLDKNGDGAIDKAEMEEAIQQAQKRFEALRQQRQPQQGNK